jgi:multidrug efflux pump subunit AcrA (membrane-fusion protein)
MTKRQIIIISVSFLLFVLIILSLFSGGEEAKKEEDKQTATFKYVKVEKVKNDTLPIVLSGYGRVTSSKNINIISEVSGILLPGLVELKPGINFSKGQLLYKINDKEARLALSARKSSFLNLLAQSLPDIKIDFPDAYEKWNNFFNDIDLNKFLPELPEIKSNKEKTFLASKNILSEYYNIRGDEERLKKHNIIAPFDGTVVSVNAETGSVVNPGNPIATIIKTHSLEIEVPVKPENISMLKNGMPANIIIEKENKQWEGKVVRIGNNINPATQTLYFYVRVNNDVKNQLYSGMYAKVIVKGEEIPSAYEIPRRALLDNNQVFIVSKDSLLLKKSVEIVKLNNNTAIIKGLNNEEIVVTEPVTNAKEKIKVAPIYN